MFVQSKLLERGEISTRNKFQKHLNVLAWKSYVQRQRRWRILVLEMMFAACLFLLAAFIAKPVFLTPLEDEPEPPFSSEDLLKSFEKNIIIGYAPNKTPYSDIMVRAAQLLDTDILAAENEQALDHLLYERAKGKKIVNQVSWILWEETKDNNIIRFRIRSTKHETVINESQTHTQRNPYMQGGFLALETAVSHSIIELITQSKNPPYELNLVSMPVTPLMDEGSVRRVISLILMCYTVALLPPVLETEALVVTETRKRFKLAMRHRGVDYSTMYLAWLLYAFLTALPICLLGSITLILIFRWIHLVYALLTLVSYFTVMMMLALIMSLAHDRAIIACTWSILQTLLQTFLAELMVHHEYDKAISYMGIVIHTFLPPLGLLNGLNQFALLQTGSETSNKSHWIGWMILLWLLLIVVYFLLLMLLQRTVARNAIGGQVSWKTIIFKQAEDNSQLRPIKQQFDTKRKLQEVDDLVAKAISFRDVSKSIMGVPQLTNVTFDIYRGEYTMLFSERIQEKMMTCVEDLLTGLAFTDSGTINVLGVEMHIGRNLLTEPTMMGYFDRSSFLIPDLTVEEHFFLFAEMSLWNESSESVLEYIMIRTKRLKTECELAGLEDNRIWQLGMYYRAQLCWAIATLLEPRVLILSDFIDDPIFMAVMRDKIVQHRKHLSLVRITLSSIGLEEADRVFLMDNHVLAFGGTPAFMFFKYGWDYRIRINFRIDADNDETSKELLKNVHKYGAAVRAQVGSLLILRIPLEPSAQVAKLVEEIEANKEKYKITSLNVSLADPEEVFRRSIHESRVSENIDSPDAHFRSKAALAKLKGPTPWKRHLTSWSIYTHLRIIGWKYFAFYIHYRFLLIVTLLVTMVAGLCMGHSLSKTLQNIDAARYKDMAEVLTVEALGAETTLTLRLDESEQAKSVAVAYVMSINNATAAQVGNINYIALPSSESLTEYLVTRAIDSPQHYVKMHAYGIDLHTRSPNTIVVLALYSPLHADNAAAARSLGRAYLALVRHFTGHIDAFMEITDDPLLLDAWAHETAEAPLLIQFLLVLTISHMVVVPSKEYGLIRFVQTHAMNFSPVRYWVLMAFCDLILYWILVMVMAALSCLVLYITVRTLNFVELVAVPFMLMVYGVGCVPQAYLFSLGPQSSLNSMALVITNIVLGTSKQLTIHPTGSGYRRIWDICNTRGVADALPALRTIHTFLKKPHVVALRKNFGGEFIPQPYDAQQKREATIIAKLFYGNAYDFAIYFMSLSPQFNMAYALVKIREIYLYNNECRYFKSHNLCVNKTLHMCCEKCGVLQACFKKRSYIDNIMPEVMATLGTSVFFMFLLLLWEYRVISFIWNAILRKLFFKKAAPLTEEFHESPLQERNRIHETHQELLKKSLKSDECDYLMAVNVSRIEQGVYDVRNVFLGINKGETLALSGLKRHGRVTLCELMAGYKTCTYGTLWAMGKYRQNYSPHQYATNVAICMDLNPLPTWMTVYDALDMMAMLRGVPKEHVAEEIGNYIDALDLTEQQDLLICRLRASEQKRLEFAATVVGAPPILIVDECTAYQNFVVKRAMFHILNMLKRRGHAIVHSAVSVENHMPVSNRLAIMRDGRLIEIDYVDKLLDRYSLKGFTVVVHLKDDVDVEKMFLKYFHNVTINDTTDVLANVQVSDADVTWTTVFKKMQQLKEENEQVYAYVVCAKTIDYIYHSLIANEQGPMEAGDLRFLPWFHKLVRSRQVRIEPTTDKINSLRRFQYKYAINSLVELPWTVIFQR